MNCSLCLECRYNSSCCHSLFSYDLFRQPLQSKGMPSHPEPSIFSCCFLVFFITHITTWFIYVLIICSQDVSVRSMRAENSYSLCTGTSLIPGTSRPSTSICWLNKWSRSLPRHREDVAMNICKNFWIYSHLDLHIDKYRLMWCLTMSLWVFPLYLQFSHLTESWGRNSRILLSFIFTAELLWLQLQWQ